MPQLEKSDVLGCLAPAASGTQTHNDSKKYRKIAPLRRGVSGRMGALAAGVLAWE